MKGIKSDKIINDHKTILEAIENHNYELAESVMTEHLGKKIRKRRTIGSVS
ncbi:MAG: FCD domain-containing protein [Lachnospirales bacterium]